MDASAATPDPGHWLTDPDVLVLARAVDSSVSRSRITTNSASIRARLVTPNDANDLDPGAYALQNFPVVTSLDVSAESFVLNGTLDINPNVRDPHYTIRVLKTAVGSEACAVCTCDVNASGLITSGDALLVLKAAVGQNVTLSCSKC